MPLYCAVRRGDCRLEFYLFETMHANVCVTNTNRRRKRNDSTYEWAYRKYLLKRNNREKNKKLKRMTITAQDVCLKRADLIEANISMEMHGFMLNLYVPSLNGGVTTAQMQIFYLFLFFSLHLLSKTVRSSQVTI